MEDNDKPVTMEDFKAAVNATRTVKFKINHCPYVIYERFAKFAEEETGMLYPAAIEKLMDAYAENQLKVIILQEMAEIKNYLTYLETELESLKTKVEQGGAPRSFRKTFGGSQ